MILKNIKEKALTVLSLVSSLFQVVRSYLISCYPMVRAFGVCLSQRFSKNRMTEPKCRICKSNELQLWNCFSYYPSVHCFDWLAGIDGKYLGKDKKFYKGQYLFTVDWAHPETNILNTEHSEIPQEHKCAHIIALR